MRIYLGADHAGFERKNQIKAHLEAQGHEAVSYTHLTLPTKA